jgi:cob(I)alamin adenosyltransferase
MKKKYPSGGDTGASKLANGRMVAKDHVNFDAVGTVDELNSVLGWVKCACEEKELREKIEWVQNTLFEFGSYITGWAQEEFSSRPVTRLEEEIRQWQEAVPDLKGFILPDGTELAARFHIARTVCRRTERAVAHLKETGPRAISENASRFINRLSDWLFQAARLANFRAGTEETLWKPQMNADKHG